MSANGETLPQGTSEVTDVGKGKGKSTEQSDMMMEDDDEEEESAEEEEVGLTIEHTLLPFSH